MRKRLSGILIACLVLVAVNPTANGDTLSREQKKVLITGLLQKGYKQDEIPGLIELAGLAGGVSISQEARRICLEVLYPRKDTTPKQGEETSPPDKQTVEGLMSRVEELEKEDAITFSKSPLIRYKELLSKTGLDDFAFYVRLSRNYQQLEISILDNNWHPLSAQKRKHLVSTLYKLWKSVNPKGADLTMRITVDNDVVATIGNRK